MSNDEEATAMTDTTGLVTDSAATLARVIWSTSRRDEGTISATGADIIAAALIASGAVRPAAEVRAEALRDALREARAVITWYLSTAEEWRYDRVCWAFAVMLGEIPEDTPEPLSPADEREIARRAARAAKGGDRG